MNKDIKKISFVVPVYNSADSLHELYSRIVGVFNKTNYQTEIIFIDDFSLDGSWSVIQNISALDGRVMGHRLSRNFGQHNALLCGIRIASGEYIITIDDDLQHPPEILPIMLAKLDEGFDVVYGAPEKQQHGLIRNIASQITKIVLQSSMGAVTASNVSALRVFKTRIRDSFADYKSPAVNIDVLLTWGTTLFAVVNVRHDPRKVGASGYTFSKLVTHAFNMLTGFSTRPLQLASLLGFIFAILGFIILIYVLSAWLVYGSVVPGFAFLASIFVIFSGVQMLALGIIGEYLARMHLRAMEKPSYVVYQDTNQRL